jgi:hypothetical protein
MISGQHGNLHGRGIGGTIQEEQHAASQHNTAEEYAPER